MHNYRELKIWQKSRTLVNEVYQMTKSFPKDEMFGLTSQTRRAAVSVPANIAEGSGRSTSKDFGHFLDIALGSLFELETLLILARDNALIQEENLMNILNLTSEIGKMITGFKSTLSNI